MKYAITALLALCCTVSRAQINKTEINLLNSYQEVVIVDSTTKKEDLFKKAKIYFVDNFKSANDVIQYQDQNDGKIIGKGYFSFMVPNLTKYVQWDVFYSTEITCKDGNYRYRIYDISIKDIWPGMVRELTVDEAIKNTTVWGNRKLYIKLVSGASERFESGINAIKTCMSKENRKNDSNF